MFHLYCDTEFLPSDVPDWSPVTAMSKDARPTRHAVDEHHQLAASVPSTALMMQTRTMCVVRYCEPEKGLGRPMTGEGLIEDGAYGQGWNEGVGDITPALCFPPKLLLLSRPSSALPRVFHARFLYWLEWPLAVPNKNVFVSWVALSVNSCVQALSVQWG